VTQVTILNNLRQRKTLANAKFGVTLPGISQEETANVPRDEQPGHAGNEILSSGPRSQLALRAVGPAAESVRGICG